MTKQNNNLHARVINLDDGGRIVGIVMNDKCIAVRLEDSDNDPYSWGMPDDAVSALKTNIEKVGVRL